MTLTKMETFSTLKNVWRQYVTEFYCRQTMYEHISCSIAFNLNYKNMYHSLVYILQFVYIFNYPIY